MTPGPQALDTRLLRFRANPDVEDPIRLAEDLLGVGRSADAQEVAQAGLRAKVDHPDLLLIEGRARFASGDLLGAQAALLKAARVVPSRKDPFRWLGEVLLKRGDPERAVKVLERAKSIDDRDPQVEQLLGRARRLANIAAGADAPAEPPFEPPSRPAVAAPTPAEPEERTVIRTDLTEQLRSMTASVDAAEAAERAAPLLEEEDEPTTVGPMIPSPGVGLGAPKATGRGLSGAGTRPASGAAARRPARTLTFGSPEAGIPPPAAMPPRAPKLPVEPDEEGDAPTRLERAAPPRPSAPLPPRAPLNAPTAPASSPSPPPGGGFPSASFGEAPAPSASPPAAPFPPATEAAGSPFTSPAAPPAPPPPVGAPSPFSEPSVEEHLGPETTPDATGLGAMADLGAPDGRALPPADVEVGGQPTENVDAILHMLEQQGLFERPSGDAPGWAGRKEAKPAGTRTGIWLGVAWVLALLLAVGGYFGWEEWVAYRHQSASELVAVAATASLRGDHKDLVDAERHLREARDLHPHDVAGPTLMLRVHMQRALEDGAFEAGFMRPSLARAELLEVPDATLEAARAVLAAAEGGHELAREKLTAALDAGGDDPFILYVAGRLEQRLGGDEALDRLEAAREAEPRLNASTIALAEARSDEGRADEALGLLDAILEADSEHLRARLWRLFMTSDAEDPAASLAQVEGLADTIRQHGAPTDQVVAQLTRARLLRRQGEADRAGQAVERAVRAGATEPRLLALLGREAQRAGRTVRAEQAARLAVEGAPASVEFRKLLAEVQLARRNGRGALTTLAELDDDDPDVLTMRARAALLLGNDEVLARVAEGLDAYVEAHEDANIELKALRIRAHVRLGHAREVLRDARALSRDAPGDPVAALALGEAALRTYDASTATEALQQVVAAAPDDAEGHYLLGRAARMAGDGEQAESSLRRAIELTPEHVEARLALGGLLLDLGKFEEADTLYQELARRSGIAAGQAVTTAGRLGRVEALIGLGRLDDANVQMEGLRPDAREAPSARMTAARLALARGRPGDALTAIRPLASGEAVAPGVLALYGDALLAAAQAEAASEAYDAALAADAALPEALLGKAELAVRSERSSDALRSLTSLEGALRARIRPPAIHARAQLLRGRAHLVEGRSGLERARSVLRAASEAEGVPPEVFFFLGEALAGENTPAAREAYERYIELAPEGSYAARARRALASRR